MAAEQICALSLPFFSFCQAFVSASPSFLIAFCFALLTSLVPCFRCSLFAPVSCSSLAFISLRVFFVFLCNGERTTTWFILRMK